MRHQRMPPREFTSRLLREDARVSVHFDPGAPGVRVPSELACQAHATLIVDPRAKERCELRDDELCGVFTLDDGDVHCVVPWEAVFAVASEGGGAAFWPGKIPPGVRVAAQAPSLPSLDTRRLPVVH